MLLARFGELHKNLLNGSGIRSTSRAAGPSVAAASPGRPTDATLAEFGYAKGGQVCSRGG